MFKKMEKVTLKIFRHRKKFIAPSGNRNLSFIYLFLQVRGDRHHLTPYSTARCGGGGCGNMTESILESL